MTWVYASLLALLNLVWLGLVVLGLPGNWLIVATTAAYAWWRWDSAGPDRPPIAIWTLAVMAALAMLAELLELIGGLVGARRAGGSKWGAVGALVGTVVGAILGTFLIPVPILGSILGACGGAAAGAWMLEYATGRPFEPALKSAAGAGVGRFAGIVAKLGVGGVIWIIAAVAAFVP